MIADTTTRGLTRQPVTSTRPGGTGRAESQLTGRFPVAAMAGLGGALAVIGSALPWLSFYAGLQQVRGSDGQHGLIIIALGLATVGIAALHLARGGAMTRWLLAGAGFATVAVAGYVGIGLLEAFATLSADPLLIARLEPGLGVVLLGGSAVFATVFAPADHGIVDAAARPTLSVARLALAAVLAAAGFVHLALAPEHLAQSMLLGLGFLAVGIVQVVLAPLLLVDRGGAVLAAAFVVSLGSVLALLAATTVGLPLLGHGEVMGPLGPVEAIDDVAAMTGMAEIVGVVLAFRLLRQAH